MCYLRNFQPAKKEPRWFPHMNEEEYKAFMRAKGFHFSDDEKRDSVLEDSIR